MKVPLLSSIATTVKGFFSPTVYAPLQNEGEPGWFQRDLVGSYQGNELAFSAVYSCIELVSGHIAMMPVQHWKIGPDQTNGQMTTSRIVTVLNSPNSFSTRFDLIKRLVSDCLQYGNGYLLAVRNGRGEIVELIRPMARAVAPLVTESGEIFYSIALTELDGTPAETIIAPDRDVLNLRMQTLPFNPLRGMSPIAASASATSLGRSIINQSAAFFHNQAKPAGVLQTDGKLSDVAAAKLKERWQSLFAQGGAGKTAVLEEGMKWQPLTMNAVDAALVDQLKMSVEDVARAFRVPTTLLAYDQHAWKSVESLYRQYLTSALSPIMTALELQLGKLFGLNPDKDKLEFDESTLLRAEFETRMQALSKAVQGGIYSPNEARQMENLPPVDGGNEPFLQRQMVPVSLANELAVSEISATSTSASTPTEPTPTTSEAMFTGLWSAEKNYKLNQVATLNGCSWACSVEGTKSAPGESEDWKLVAKQGEKGRSGRGIKKMKINKDNHIVVDYTDGSTETLKFEVEE